MTLKYIWRSLQPRLSFPRPFQLSMACFRVAIAELLVDILILWGDIRDQSRKLSKITKNFGRFCWSHKFFGAGLVKIVPNLLPLPLVASTEKSPVRILPLVRKLLSLTGWILGQIFNFHDWNFSWGPPSQLGCALGRPSRGQSLARIKISNFMAQHPLRAEI